MSVSLKLILSLLFLSTFSLCYTKVFTSPFESKSLVNPTGTTIETRFKLPHGFLRTTLSKNSFGEYLRKLPLKSDGSEVLLYNGQKKTARVHEAVVDMEIGKKDLQQCADACIRLRSEYLYKEKRYADIHFNFTNGWRADYVKWSEGNRIVVEGNKSYWKKTANSDNSYSSFRNYLDKVFTYAGTLSLSRELIPVDIKDIRIGDVFIQGGSPGHAVMVVDMAEDAKTGQKIFMLAQSYMPAQDIHILKNPHQSGSQSPWYNIPSQGELVTPEWTFRTSDLKRFKD